MTLVPFFRLISDSASVEGDSRSLIPTWHLTVPRYKSRLCVVMA